MTRAHPEEADGEIAADIPLTSEFSDFEFEDFDEDPEPAKNNASISSNPLHSRGVRWYILCLFCGSFMTAISKYAMETVDAYFIMGVRMFGTFVPSAFWLWYKKEPGFFFGPRDVRMLLVARGAVGTANIAAVYYAIQHIRLPDYTLLNFLSPLLTAVAAHFFLGEGYRWQQAVASVISLLGVVVIARPPLLFGSFFGPGSDKDPQHDAAIIVQLLQVVGTTAVLCLLRVIGTRAHPLASVSMYAFQCVLFASIAIVIQTLLNKQLRLPTNSFEWMLVGLTGVAGFLYQFLLSVSFAAEKATVLTQFDYITILYYLAWEFFLWHRFPDWITLCGGALILAGVFASSRVQEAAR